MLTFNTTDENISSMTAIEAELSDMKGISAGNLYRVYFTEVLFGRMIERKLRKEPKMEIIFPSQAGQNKHAPQIEAFMLGLRIPCRNLLYWKDLLNNGSEVDPKSINIVFTSDFGSVPKVTAAIVRSIIYSVERQLVLTEIAGKSISDKYRKKLKNLATIRRSAPKKEQIGFVEDDSTASSITIIPPVW